MKCQIVSSPENCLKGMVVQRELGKGDMGIAYEVVPGAQSKAINAALDPNGHYVLKQVKLTSDASKEAFAYEAKIGSELGLLGIAPHIYACWYCSDGNGYIVMDKLSQVWDKVYGSYTNYTIPPVEVEKDLIRKLIIMVRNGYLHQDCHIGNIGFINNEVVLFDFGFTVHYSPCDCAKNYPALLLASQLAIVNEQLPLAKKKRSLLFQLTQYIYSYPFTTLDEVLHVLESEDLSVYTNAMHEKPQSPVPLAIQVDKINFSLHKVPPCDAGCRYVAESILMAWLYMEIQTYSVDDYIRRQQILNDMFDEENIVYELIYKIRRAEISIKTIQEWIATKLPKRKRTSPSGFPSLMSSTMKRLKSSVRGTRRLSPTKRITTRKTLPIASFKRMSSKRRR